MTNYFSSANATKPINLANNINPFITASTSTGNNNQANQSSFQNSSSNLITNYFPQNATNQVPSKPMSSPFNSIPNQLSNPTYNSFEKANEYKPNTTSAMNGLNSNNPFLLGHNSNNNAIGTNAYSNQNSQPNQSNPFQTSNNYSGNTNNTYNQSTNSNPFFVTNNNTPLSVGGVTGQQFKPFNTSNQVNTNGPFNYTGSNNITTTTNTNSNPFTTQGTSNNFVNANNINQFSNNNNSNVTTNNPFNMNSNNSNANNTNANSNANVNANNNNPFSTNSQTTMINNTSNQNNTTLNNNPFNLNNPINNNSSSSPFQTNTTNTNNHSQGFTPSFNTNTNTTTFPQSQSNTSINASSQPQMNQSDSNNTNPFNIQPTSNQPTFNAPFYSTYPTNTPFSFPQQQSNNNYPNYSQLPYDIQYVPIFINQNYNYHHPMNQTIEEIESKYLAQYINDSIINKEKEKKVKEHNDINSILINHYEENQHNSYYLPSYTSQADNNKENEFDLHSLEYHKLSQIHPRKRKNQHISTQNKIILKSNQQLSSVKPFKLSSNTQSTIKKQYSISNLSQSSRSSVSQSICDSNCEYEVTISFETPIRLTKVVKSRRYLNKAQIIKDIVKRFSERRMIITSKDFVLLLNGVVIGNEPNQIDLSKEAFSFSEVDPNVKKISIAGYFYQNKTEDIILEEDPQGEMNQDDSFGQIKDDFYPKTNIFKTTPSMKELSSMSKTQLENVKSFSLGNCHGKLFFDDVCDLTYVNLDHIKIESYLVINIQQNNIFIDKLRMKCTAEFYNILLDDTSFYQMNEVKRLCESNLKSDQFHYVKELEKLIVIVDLTKL